MVRTKIGDIFCDTLTLSDTSPKRFVNESTALSMLWVYTATQNAYVGRKGNQDFLLVATANYTSTDALPLVDVDLADIWFRAATAGAVIHAIGTYKAQEEIIGIVVGELRATERKIIEQIVAEKDRRGLM
jgi:hypothetical protein